MDIQLQELANLFVPFLSVYKCFKVDKGCSEVLFIAYRRLQYQYMEIPKQEEESQTFSMFLLSTRDGQLFLRF